MEAPQANASDTEMVRVDPGGADIPARWKHARIKTKNAAVEIALNGGAHDVKM